ncbi:hypothetical protein SCATT_28580 [Streptantibioticus cattleyicolor NRRL 8057 = DSM 46488]|uniref:Uncharacterized protein n=1 Tax=Streptantibioticus cattleyicolor (strain ATCC 35852 / DSM 46488 / JCM 4925 / NBRC 14057 / NRRL 8057) TaxID=1003195 RepID=G8WQL6_STREN|nr:hypothetical protein SCATT_28580 [Streptantibioticus cattleyicolor NRRL 8057 = DSM 46488]
MARATSASPVPLRDTTGHGANRTSRWPSDAANGRAASSSTWPTTTSVSSMSEPRPTSAPAPAPGPAPGPTSTPAPVGPLPGFSGDSARYPASGDRGVEIGWTSGVEWRISPGSPGGLRLPRWPLP